MGEYTEIDRLQDRYERQASGRRITISNLAGARQIHGHP